MMIFEKAIEDAANMFLFDRGSQQKFHEMAEQATPNSKDRFLIRLTHAAFVYYNAFEAQGWDIPAPLRQATWLLREVKQYREDRIFFTLALRMEVDLLLHTSRLQFQEAKGKDKNQRLFNEEDARALSICDTLLQKFPVNLEPLPNAWFTSLIPLFPTFQEEVLKFYTDRVKENRIIALQSILQKIRAELIMAAGIIMAKKFLASTHTDFSSSERVRTLLLGNVREVMTRLEDKMPVLLQVVSDVSVPKGFSTGQLELAITNVEAQIKDANESKDLTKYTTLMLQMGILNFLRGNDSATVKTLVTTLRASKQLSPEIRKSRQYRHEEFSDISFMIGTSFLRLAVAARGVEQDGQKILEESKAGLLQSIILNPHYHQAYVNLVLTLNLASEPGLEEAVNAYLNQFGRDIAHLDGQLFRNLALLEFQAQGEMLHPEALKWLIISYFCQGGELTKGGKMLQDLKTLYILNAHDYSSSYLTTYRSALRQNDEELIYDLEDSAFHSALLFYIAHAFTSRSLQQGKGELEVVVEHELLDQSIELNSDSLYFNSNNFSARRLVETQNSILMFVLKRTEKRWENINQNLSHRFQFYEEYLREMKSYTLLRDRLSNLKLENLVPEVKFSETAISHMEGTLSTEQKDRLRNRVELA